MDGIDASAFRFWRYALCPALAVAALETILVACLLSRDLPTLVQSVSPIWYRAHHSRPLSMRGGGLRGISTAV